MYSVSKNEYSFMIKNSKFIALIFPIFHVDEVITHLNEVKVIYPDATHYCYAYIIDQVKRENDDGEPSGTAGIPILQVLEKNHLNYVLCIVVRYFGKIKLGAGGLIRAYSKAVSLCIENHIVELKKAMIIRITFPYSASKKIDHLLSNSKILFKDFSDDVVYEVVVDKELYNILNNLGYKITILRDEYMYID